jgi:hypothetical protein
MLQRREEAVLHGVVRVRLLAQHGERHPVRRTDVTLHERLECRVVAVLCTNDEIGVCRLFCLLGKRARPHSVINA